MINKRILVLFLALCGLGVSTSFGMDHVVSIPGQKKTVDIGNGVQNPRPVPTQKQRAFAILSQDLKTYCGVDLTVSQLEEMDEETIQLLVQRANDAKNNFKLLQKQHASGIEQVVKVGKKKKEQAETKSSFSRNFQVARSIAVALTAAWRINHYATKVCTVLGRNDLLNSPALNLGSLAAAGALALLDYYSPRICGAFLAGALFMDALNKNLTQSALPAFTSPRLG